MSFYSSPESLTVLQELTGEPLPPPVAGAPAPEPEAIAQGAAAPSDGILAAASAPRALPTTDTKDTSSTGPVIGGVVGALAGIILCVLIGLFIAHLRRSRKRRHIKRQTEQVLQSETKRSDNGIGSVAPNHSLGPASSFGGGSSIHQNTNESLLVQSAMPRMSSGGNPAVSTVGQMSSMPSKFGVTTYWDTFCATVDPSQPSGSCMTTNPSQPPPKDAHIADRLEFLHTQLDTFGVNDVIMDRFFLLGYAHRRQGGQGLVAFARGVRDQLDYAIKFFLVQESFEAERSLYKTKALGALLPQVEAEYDPEKAEARLQDSRGIPLPPFIVMEKGESLSDWTERSHPDLFQGIAVLVHVATRLRDMHAAGYVHRDIKPGNIMLLPRKNAWTVIDFGCTAKTGEHASLSFTVQYCPPEVIEAYLAKERSIIATEAMDAWAMGVVAFELLTGGSAFSLVHGSNQIMKQLQGEEELPWEGDKNIDARRKLGMFRQPILSLLRRDASERNTLASFCSSCQEVFTSTSTPNSLMPQ